MLSIYDEEETLFSCYNRFLVIKTEKNKIFNNRNYEFVIELQPMDVFEKDLPEI